MMDKQGRAGGLLNPSAFGNQNEPGVRKRFGARWVGAAWFAHGVTGLPTLAVVSLVLLVSVAPVKAKDNQPAKATAAEQTNKVNTAEEKAAASDEATDDNADQPDLAYGAFQRGEYLTALSLALEDASKGDAAAQTLVATLYDRGLGVPKDESKAAEWYAIAAKSGNREAQFAYGSKLISGKGVKADAKAGYDMIKQAADQGHFLACFNYGNFVLTDNPTSKGVEEAKPYLEKAAKGGVVEANYLLSQIYSGGVAGGRKEPEKETEYLRRAAEGGLDTAQVELAIILLNGSLGEPDLKQGTNWMIRAASQGNVIAQNRLAHMYTKGVGVDRDEEKAAIYYLLSSRAGLTDVELADFYRNLSDDIKKKALAVANRRR